MRAKPILAVGAVAGALAFPLPAYALGLGKLTVDSALGQPLSARIELTSVTPAELDTLAIKVADPTLYRQNHLAYNPVLSRARITLERRAGGESYLKVVTRSAINEPYLDLMVELNWASGRLVRDYTFLLDPPGIAPTPVDPVAPARVGVAPARPAGVPAAAASRASGAPGASGTYQVKRGDTLSKIASEFSAPSLTLEQMLVALFTANPDAFDGENINRLRAGSIMTLPSAEDAAKTPQREAMKLVRMQASDWRAYRDRVAATAPSSPAAGARTAGGKIGTAVVDSAPAPPPGRDQLKVSRDAGAGKGAAATVESIARERQIQEAQQRIVELEKTLNELQRAVELKNQAMAKLQAQVEAGNAQAAKAPGMKVADAAQTVAANPPTDAVPRKAAALAPSAPAAKKERSFLDDLMADTPTWAIGGGALALLVGIFAIIAARRRSTTRFEDDIIADTDIKTNTVFGSTGGGVVNTGDNSLSSEFSREGLGSIDADEVDPIAEAEVYLAYGRDAQAEEILKHALRKEPQRQEIYLKLLEIHAQHNKPSAFETVAADLYSMSKGQGETWQKAAALGRQLEPNNPMFAEAGTATPAASVPLAAAAPLSAPRVDAKPDPLPDGPAAARGGGNSFDFRLDEDLAAVPNAGARPKAADGLPAGVENEREKTARGAGAPASVHLAAATAATIEQKIETARLGADLDFHLDEAEKPAPLHGAANKAADGRREPATSGFDKLEFSFDSDKAQFEDATPSVLDGQWHDAATKLDLAKAYQEMGDVEGAREILQEVLREGDGQQKTEAEKLIARLG